MMWRLLNTGYRTGRFNMAFDEQLAFAVKEKTSFPTLRLYGWKPYTLSIGFNQHEEEFDRTRLRQEHIDIVKRPTGGRAILHAHELTYSVAMKLEGKSPKELYRFINEGLLCGLGKMGISATLAGTDDNFRSLYQQPTSIPCFASSAKYEIQFDGKKLVGSAQRRYGDVILQHGSLLLGRQHRRIVEFISPHAEAWRNIIAQELLNKTIEAETILEREIYFDETADCISRGCAEAWDASFTHEGVLNEEYTIV